MPDLVRRYAKHVMIGFAIATVFVAMLLYFDIAQIGHRVSQSENGWLAILMLWVVNGVIFAGVQSVVAVLIGDDDDDDGPRGGGHRHEPHGRGQMIPVRVAAGGSEGRGRPRH